MLTSFGSTFVMMCPGQTEHCGYEPKHSCRCYSLLVKAEFASVQTTGLTGGDVGLRQVGLGRSSSLTILFERKY